MPEVNMPKLSDTMEEGTVLEWKVDDGAEVKRGQAIAEIESDKASFEIEAEADGALHIVVGKGESAPVGELIATIGGDAPAKKEAPAAKPEAKQEKQERQPVEEETDAAQPAAAAGKEGPERQEAPDAEEPEREPEAEPAEEAPRPAARAERDGVKASPIARRLAEERGVDLASIQGSGPDGRIVKEDVLRAAESGGESAGKQPAPARPAPRPRTGPDVEIEEPSRMQATIAKRMAVSKSTVPHFYVTVEANVEEAVKMRQQLKETVPGAEKVTMTDMLVRACALALQKFPEVNASWVDGHFERKRSVNIGLAVPPAQGLGLLVPVIHDCDRKDLVQISIESRQVIERARSGRPGTGDLEGGTFSISNLGMYGVDEFNAIINPPEAGILAVGAIKDAPVVVDGQLRAGKVMRMTLSVDHRVFYGVTGAQFMAEVRRLIENPVSLVLPPSEGS